MLPSPLQALRDPKTRLPAFWQPVAKVSLHSTDEASRLTALLVGQIFPICSLLCDWGSPNVTIVRTVPVPRR